MTYPQSPTAVDLVFEKPSSVTNPLEVNLVFGETSGPPVDAEYEAVFNARFKLRGAVVVNYDSAVWRGVSSSIEAPHQMAAEVRQVVSNLWQPSQQAEHNQRAEFSDGKRLDKGVELDWSVPLTAEQASRLVWQQALAAERTADVDWRSATPANEQHRSAWQEGLDLSTSSGLRFGLAKASPATIITPWELGAPAGASIRAPLNRAGKPVEHLNTLPWQQARTLASNGAQRPVRESEDLSLEDYFQRFVIEHQDSMSETELARKLGVSRKCLWERRQRLGIPRTKNSAASLAK